MAVPRSPDDGERPRALHNSKSFTRSPASPTTTPTRSQRAFTLPTTNPPSITMPDDDADPEKSGGDAEAKESTDDELPIELASMADSFVDSLSARVHALPPSMDRLSTLFQNFYVTAANHINTHISAMASKQTRNGSTPPTPTRTTTGGLLRSRAGTASKDPKQLERRHTDQQMLTAEEIAERKKARKELENKRVAFEEAVERRVCERIYDKVWRHRITQDEAQDEKLRSKTAALAVVGIGLTDLGVDLGEVAEDSSQEERAQAVREWLHACVAEIAQMNDERYPLGKLQHLKAAHKCIVETLSHFHPSSSADEIMPMLIYALIISPPDTMSVISNLYFIQRFRAESKIDGEAAYCLTNLEAAITFLDTVDLSTLREDEAPTGPPKTLSQPSTPRSDQPDLIGSSAATRKLSTSPATAVAERPSSQAGSEASLKLQLIAEPRTRRLSGLNPAQAFGAASDAVLNTADQGFKSIGNSLGDSYKFLVGKLTERQISGSGDSEIVVPKTLDDARKLVGTSPSEHSESGESENEEPERPKKTEDKLLNIVAGKATPRDRSVDSSRSNSSNRRVAFAGKEPDKAAASNPAIVESMRNLGNSLNPMSRIANMGGITGGISMMRGFGRAPPTPVKEDAKTIDDGGVADLTTVSTSSESSANGQAFPELAGVLPPKENVKVAPPIQRFMDVQNPGELRLNEVVELLKDYRRLAGALKDLGAV